MKRELEWAVNFQKKGIALYWCAKKKKSLSRERLCDVNILVEIRR
jgi:hypothetical protein